MKLRQNKCYTSDISTAMVKADIMAKKSHCSYKQSIVKPLPPQASVVPEGCSSWLPRFLPQHHLNLAVLLTLHHCHVHFCLPNSSLKSASPSIGLTSNTSNRPLPTYQGNKAKRMYSKAINSFILALLTKMKYCDHLVLISKPLSVTSKAMTISERTGRRNESKLYIKV